MLKIGFIGLGVMGSPMCANILRKLDAKIYVFDINQEALYPLVDLGAIKVSTYKEINDNCDVIITMLPKSEHVSMVYDELLKTVRENQIYIDMSTISPKVSVNIANRLILKNAFMIDAPVVKSKDAAIKGELGIYVGGLEDVYDKVYEILRTMGNNIIYLGGNGSGLTMKICHNALVAQIQNGVNEIYTLAHISTNMSMDTFAKAVSYGGAQNFYLDSKKEVIKNSNFEVAFSVENMNKDIHLAKDLCDEFLLNYEGINLSAKRYEEAMERDLGKFDFSATIKLFDGRIK
ncbi:MAG: NAD(P)-dependent oxidoreductase [Erysipelotrichaceae bacterium]